jgi:hypothetical protein
MIFMREMSTHSSVYFKMWEAFTIRYSLLVSSSILNFRVPFTFLQSLANFTKSNHIKKKKTIIKIMKTKLDILKRMGSKRKKPPIRMLNQTKINKLQMKKTLKNW